MGDLMVDVLSAELDQLHRHPRRRFGWECYARMVHIALIGALLAAGY